MIPKEWEGKDFYQVLGIMRDARMEGIKAAHRRLVRAFHPDLAPSADSAEKFRAVTLAYEVLGNPTLRAQYDEYYFTDTRENAALYVKRKPFMRLLMRAALFVLILLLLKNLGYLGNTTIINQSGNGQTATAPGDSNNQVLALMAGPQGPPGPAGVAGRDGFVGLNGYQGKDGLPGAPGAVGLSGPTGAQGIQGIQGIQGVPGPAGAAGAQGVQGLQGQGVSVVSDPNACNGAGGVIITGTTTVTVCNGSGGTGGGEVEFTRFSGVAGECQEGGVRLNTFGRTDYQYVCDGKSGATFGQGRGNLATCVSQVKYAITSKFINQNFKVKKVEISDLTACAGKQLDIYLKILDSPTLQENAARYTRKDQIHCQKTLPNPGTRVASFDGSYVCEVQDGETGERLGPINLGDVFSLDVTDSANGIALEITG